MKKYSHIPFKVSNCPFFYGWAIALVGALGILMSLPGQTIGVSAFNEPVMAALSLSRSQLALAYLAGTVTSSLFLTPAGKMYDRYGARIMAISSAIVLGFVLIFLSYSSSIQKALQLDTTATMIMMAFGFFILRFSGQGVLTMTCRNMTMKWFDHFRGLVNGVQGPIVTLGFSMTPAWFGCYINLWGWDMAWRYLGIFALAVFTIFAWIFYRDNPEECGLIPDGAKAHARKVKKEFPINREMDLKDARKTVSFWATALTLAYHGLFVTAFSYHHQAIFKASGIDLEWAIRYFFLSGAILSVFLKVAGGILSDRVSIRTLLYIFSIGHILSAAGFLLLKSTAGVGMMIIGLGIMNGFFSILAGVCYPRLFGRKHLGAISGLSMSIIVFSSAIGPYLFSKVNDLTGSFTGNFYIMIVLIVIILGLTSATANPQLKLAEQTVKSGKS